MDSVPTYFSYNSPVGIITVASNGKAISHVSLGKQVFEGVYKPSSITNETASQLQEYLSGKRKAFSIALAPEGSSFQRKIWETMQNIPYGESMTYEQIARLSGDEKSYRSVGAAAKKNPVLVLIPSHRVVAATGKPSGTAEQQKIAQYLLELEQQHS